MQRYVIFFITVILLILPLNLAFSASIHYSASQLSSGDIFLVYSGDFQIDIPYGQYNSLDVYVFKKSATNLPEELELVSNVYDYYILSPEVNDQSIFNITLSYQSESVKAKNIYKWNNQEKSWEFQPSIADLDNQNVSALIKGRKGKILVLESPTLETDEDEVNYQNQFNLSLPESLATVQATTKIESFSALIYPEEKIRASNIYQFDVKSEQPIDLTEPIKLTVKLQSTESTRKAVYYWDNNQDSWVYLPSWTNYHENSVSAYIHLPFSRIALFEEPNQFVGEASWYAWKGGNFAASRDYPKGTRLKVTNITLGSKNFNKSIIVTINDYGPEEWTGRIIDLDKVAFRQIGYLGGGVMPVRIEVIE